MNKAAKASLMCIVLVLTVVLVGVAVGCGGGSTSSTASTQMNNGYSTPTPTPAPSTSAQPQSNSGDLGGNWNGQWTDTSPDNSAGTFTLQWSQQGDALTGTVTIKGAGCISGGSVTGTISGSQINFGIVSGQVTINYTGTISGNNSMSGTYSTGANCRNASGNWSAMKQ